MKYHPMPGRLKHILSLLMLLFFVLSNFTILNNFLPQSYPHRYCSDGCRFNTYERAKGHDPVGSVEIEFNNYKNNVGKPDMVLYRRFYRKWWQIWNWVDFLTNRRWNYPYAEKDEDT